MLDAVIVHELAHLVEAGHSSRFAELEDRYPRRRDAELYLEGYALGLQMPPAGPSNCGSDLGEVGLRSRD